MKHVVAIPLPADVEEKEFFEAIEAVIGIEKDALTRKDLGDGVIVFEANIEALNEAAKAKVARLAGLSFLKRLGGEPNEAIRNLGLAASVASGIELNANDAVIVAGALISAGAEMLAKTAGALDVANGSMNEAGEDIHNVCQALAEKLGGVNGEGFTMH